MTTPSLHWRLSRDADQIATLILDSPDTSTHTLSQAVMAEFALRLDELEAAPPRALVIRSAKSGFIAGADINEFSALETREGALELVARGWRLFNRLAAAPFPTLAVVRGHCLGGGLELALACRRILVVDDPATRLGLPEVQLGIVPGWGGMLRLPQRVGPLLALQLMLSGKTLSARRAKACGLADECVPERVLEAAIGVWALNPPPRRLPPPLTRLARAALNGPFKFVAAALASRQLRRRVRREHYPAPYAIISLWHKAHGDVTARPDLLYPLIDSPTARHLVRVFHLQERLKTLGKAADGQAIAPIQRVHVIGAGVMGGDIAAVCALAGLTVSLQDQDPARMAQAMQRAAQFFAKRNAQPHLCRAAWDRLIPDAAGDALAHADLVIEAVFENLAAKQALFMAIEAKAPPAALLATNTSSLRLADIRRAMRSPERLIGLHFFNPVAQMPLVEIVAAQGVAPLLPQRAAHFVRQIGKLPLPVTDTPGFLVNAALAPYLAEAMRCLDEGIRPATIDAALREFGMPLGPIELIDTIGLDIARAAGEQLAGESPAPRCLSERIAAGHLGKKRGRGFYRYDAHGKARNSFGGNIPPGLAQRLIAPLLARTRQLVSEGVVADDDLADAGVIFGAGFAPHTGGPLCYLKEQAAR